MKEMNESELLKVCIGTILANTMLVIQNLDLSKADIGMLEQLHTALDTSDKLLEMMSKNVNL